MTDLDRIIAEMREASRAQRKISQREFSCGLHDWADRLAALAGAEPVAHIYQGDCPDDWQPDARDSECPACQTMKPHAPAKAREVTEADVQAAYNVLVNYGVISEETSAETDRAAIRAALATFAEGAEPSDERRE